MYKLDSVQLRKNFSLNVLIRMLVLAAAGLAILIWKLDFIDDVYFRNQLTPTGIIINGAIVAKGVNHRIETPENTLLSRQVREIEARYAITR